MGEMITCKVCGRDFPLTVEEHYVAQDPEKIGVIARLADTSKNKQYDAFDCPHCGCQNIVQERKPLWLPEEFDCTEDEEEDVKPEGVESVEDKRAFLVDYCRGRFCAKCPLYRKEFVCGRGYSFSSDSGSDGYMNEGEIERHYKAVKEAENE